MMISALLSALLSAIKRYWRLVVGYWTRAPTNASPVSELIAVLVIKDAVVLDLSEQSYWVNTDVDVGSGIVNDSVKEYTIPNPCSQHEDYTKEDLAAQLRLTDAKYLNSESCQAVVLSRVASPEADNSNQEVIDLEKGSVKLSDFSDTEVAAVLSLGTKNVSEATLTDLQTLDIRVGNDFGCKLKNYGKNASEGVSKSAGNNGIENGLKNGGKNESKKGRNKKKGIYRINEPKKVINLATQQYRFRP